MTHSQPEPITPPENFPVIWENPDDARLLWSLDRLHWPDPITPMFASYYTDIFNVGRMKAAQYYRRPTAALRAIRINTYLYETTILLSVSDEEQAARLQYWVQALEDTFARFDEFWAEQLTEIQEHWAFWDSFDLSSAPWHRLLAHLDETLVRATRLWEIHFIVVYPVIAAMSQFEEYYRELFPEKSSLDAYRLLQGLSNKTVETGHALWRLSRQALASAEVRRALAQAATAEVLHALTQSAEGQAFLSALQCYLQSYGQRSATWDWTHPSWIEDPTPVMNNLKAFIHPEARDPIAAMERLTVEREQAIAEARAQLAGYPKPVVEKFEMLLRAGQVGTILSEDHDFYIDFGGMYRVRRVLLEVGRRLSEAAVLPVAADVMMLSLPELRETNSALPQLNRRAMVEGRKSELAYWHNIAPPARLGTPSAAASPPDNMMVRAFGKMFAPPLTSTEANVLRGYAGSAGVARGRARVLRTLADGHTLQPGDILVAEMTSPPWTPLFATAAAIVTDTGGVLSHSAVVAREYRIPAVVGTGTATQVIRDGQMLEVDGSAGVVRLLPESEII